MKKYLLLTAALLLFSCSNSKHQSSKNGDSIDIESKEDAVCSFSKMIEVVSVETGWYDEKVPQIKIKFRNISGMPIDDLVQVKYQFIEGDEIIDEGSRFLHSGSKVAWDNGLTKTEIFKSISGYLYGGPKHVVRAKICYEDNSIIWEGNIAQRAIYF